MSNYQKIFYEKVIGNKFGLTWYVPISNDPLWNLHVSYPYDKGGYSGRNIRFYLVNGGVDVVQGPYACESFGDNLFVEDVGCKPEDIVSNYIDCILLGEK